MLEKLTAAWNVPDIRKRIQYVALIFFVYVLALHVPAAGVNHAAVERLIHSGSLFGVLDTFSGGALKKFSVIAMGIMPYINASIIFQLLTVAIPQLQAIQKEGESGRKIISRYTRYASVGLAFVQAFGLYSMFVRGGAIQSGVGNMLTTIITLTAGTMFLLWLGEQITEKGIGNGISMIIFVGIVISIPQQIIQTFKLLQEGAVSLGGVIAITLLFLATVVGVVYMTQGTRRIPIQHMRKVVGNRMTQGGSAFLPLKVNTAGVIPIIFAISIQLFPATLSQFWPPETSFGKFLQTATAWMQPGASIWASLIFVALVFFFTYFYTAIQYDTVDIADNLKKYGSLIPGIRPGRPTAEYLDKVLTRITFAGALFLAGISLIQYWAPTWTGINSVSLVGGTSLLIVVGVALETMQAIEAQMAMRNYEGFIKRRGDDSDNMMRGRAR
ncbi:MAG: preprotein translocase subunit SecY [Armatimonas sp.]